MFHNDNGEVTTCNNITKRFSYLTIFCENIKHFL